MFQEEKGIKMLLMETHPFQLSQKICSLAFPEIFADNVVFDSGPGDNRLISILCHELFDGLEKAPMFALELQ